VRIAVIDSSTLISLAHLGLAKHMSLYFDRVYVSRAVQREVNRKARFRYRLNRLYEAGVFARCAAADQTSVSLLRAELDEGEAEALVQAEERAALFFIGDEKRAREISEGMGLKPVGTLRILARLSSEDLAPELRFLVRKLQRDLRFRVSEEVIRQAIATAAEPI